MKTAVIMLGEAFRQWQKDWESYKGIGNKPKSFDEFIITFIDLEKEQIIEAYEDGKQNGMDSITNIYMYIIGEKYYYEKYKQDRELPKDVKDMLDKL